MEPLKLSIAQIREITHECREVIFDAIAAGHLKTFQVGKRHFARPAEVRKWVDYLEAQSEAGRPVSYRRKTPPDVPTNRGCIRPRKAVA